MTGDPFHDRVADWLYGGEVADHARLLDDIDRDRAATLTERCKWHGDWQMVPLDINADCPQCLAADDRAARADALHDVRLGGALTDRHDR